MREKRGKNENLLVEQGGNIHVCSIFHTWLFLYAESLRPMIQNLNAIYSSSTLFYCGPKLSRKRKKKVGLVWFVFVDMWKIIGGRYGVAPNSGWFEVGPTFEVHMFISESNKFIFPIRYMWKRITQRCGSCCEGTFLLDYSKFRSFI